jgi:hypothetical protein
MPFLAVVDGEGTVVRKGVMNGRTARAVTVDEGVGSFVVSVMAKRGLVYALGSTATTSRVATASGCVMNVLVLGGAFALCALFS